MKLLTQTGSIVHVSRENGPTTDRGRNDGPLPRMDTPDSSIRIAS